MKAKIVVVKYVVLYFTIFVMPLNAIAQDIPFSRSDLQGIYTEYLTQEGYRPEIDNDGDVVFKKEGKNYFISVDENDPEFFRIVLPNFWSIENTEERSRVLAAADESNRKSKVSKVFTVRDDTWASIEIFIAHPKAFEAVFPRAMSALENGVLQFVQKMRE